MVGDNKQVSPAAIGVQRGDMQLLTRDFFATLPFGAVLTPRQVNL